MVGVGGADPSPSLAREDISVLLLEYPGKTVAYIHRLTSTD